MGTSRDIILNQSHILLLGPFRVSGCGNIQRLVVSFTFYILNYEPIKVPMVIGPTIFL